jgi:F-type H+-transporting ATPase subunit c
MRLSNILPAVSAVSAAVLVALLPSAAFAQEAHAAAASWGNGLAAGIGMGIAAAGGAYGQGRVISAALDSISRNPGASGQLFLPWILGLAFVESLVIFTLVVAFRLM